MCDQSSVTSFVNCGCLQHLLQYKQTFQICVLMKRVITRSSLFSQGISYSMHAIQNCLQILFLEKMLSFSLNPPNYQWVEWKNVKCLINRGKVFYNFPVSTVFIMMLCSTPEHAFAKSTSLDSFLLIVHVKYMTHFLQMVDGYNLIDWSGQEKFHS